MELLFSSIHTLFIGISNIYINIGSFSFSVLDIIIFNVVFVGLLYMINVFLHIND